MAEFTWSTQTDWDNAQSRSQVVTRDVGARVADEVWQGFDPSYSPYQSLASYWTLDETSGSTAYDSVGSHDGTIENATIGYQGVLSSNAYDFDGSSDRVETTYSPPGDGVATLAYWVNFDSLDGDQLCGLNDTDSTNEFGTTDARFYVGGSSGSSQELIAGFGTEYAFETDSSLSTGTWHHIAMTGDGSTARLYFDGTELASFDYSFGSTSMGIHIGGRNHPTGPSRYIDGQVSDVMAWNQALSASDIQTIYDTVSSGSLTTATVQDDGEAVDVQTTATVPSSTSADLTLYQDTDGDGTAENQETISVSDGTNTTSLTSFESVVDAEYWAEVAPSSTDEEATVQFDGATVTTESADVEGVITMASPSTQTASVEAGIEGTVQAEVTYSSSRTLTAGEPYLNPAETTTTGSFTLRASYSGLTGEEYHISDYVDDGGLLDPVLSELDEDDTTILFPAGSTYQLGTFSSKADNLELLAPDGNVTIESIGEQSTLFQFSGDAWRLRGFEFDFRDASPKQIRAAGSGWAITDCVWRGQMAWDDAHPAQAIAAQVDYARGEGRIRGCYFPDGSGEYGTAVREMDDSIGTVQVQKSWFEDWTNAAIDTRAGFGPVQIVECYVHNCTGGIRLNGPAQLMSSTVVCDGETPTAASGHDTMECWLAGDRRTDSNTVYIEACDFVWLSSAGSSAGHPIDDTTGVEHLHVFASRFHNESSKATFAIGGGNVDLYQTEATGMARTIRQTGGFFSEKEIRGGSGMGADPSPTIPDPPALGETPTTDDAGGVKVGQPGGSSGRFYGF